MALELGEWWRRWWTVGDETWLKNVLRWLDCVSATAGVWSDWLGTSVRKIPSVLPNVGDIVVDVDNSI